MVGKTLYVGADDSNNHDSRNSRILTTVFSSDISDAPYRYFSKDRKREDLFYWLNTPSSTRDFRFSLLTEECFKTMQPILPLAIPRLVLNYVPTIKEQPSNIWISIDGILPRDQGEYIRNSLKPYFSEVIVRNVVKRRNEQARMPKNKKLFCPRVLKMADICANELYDSFDTARLEQRVVLDQAKLRDLYIALRR